mmetsp:Transcript_79414/g.170168  ORF Transcript_79414/g.170168 Transcript_79414/m.170168 type:complete len:383 (+) Transcript_79414:71-1219(+)
MSLLQLLFLGIAGLCSAQCGKEVDVPAQGGDSVAQCSDEADEADLLQVSRANTSTNSSLYDQNPKGTTVSKKVGICRTKDRPSWSNNRVSKEAVDMGIEGLKMALYAYMLEIPGSADSQKESYGSDWPGDPSWKNMFEDLQEVHEDGAAGDGDGAFAYVAKFKGATVVAFAGTTFDGINKDVADDLTSLYSVTANLGGINYEVGVGWYRAYASLLAKGLEDKVKNMAAQTENRILCVGHSLGGALANLCAVHFANLIYAKVILRSYESPRVFTTASTSSIQHNLVTASPSYGVDFPAQNGIVTQRWVIYGDLVPSLPPCRAGYYHMGNGGIDLYDDNGIIRGLGAYGFQHLDFTPWQDGFSAGNHRLVPVYERMRQVRSDLR